MKIISLIFFLIIICLGLSFSFLNSGTVNLNYYVGHSDIPLSLLLASVFTIGCLLGIAVSLGLLFKVKIKNYRLRQRLKLAEKEIENLRAIPLQNKH